MQTLHPKQLGRFAALTPLFCCVPFWLASCQSYRPRPLDLEAYAKAFATRAEQADLSESVDALLGANVGAPPRSLDLADGLSAEEAEVLALFFNPALRRARMEAGLSAVEADFAGRWEDPRLGFDAAQVLSPQNLFEFGATLGLSFPISGRKGIEAQRAQLLSEAARWRLVASEWELRTELRITWARWVRAAGGRELADQRVEQLDRWIPLVRQLEDLGALSTADARLVDLERVQARASALAAAGTAEALRGEILAWIGLPPDATVELQSTFPYSPAAPVGGAEQSLLLRHPRLLAARAEYEAAQRQLALEIAKQIPDFDLSLGGGSENDDRRMLLGLSLPLPLWNANRGPIAAARRSRDISQVEAELVLERLHHQFARAQRELQVARATRKLLEAELVPLLDRQQDALTALSRDGAVDALLLLESLTSGLDARAQLIDLAAAEAQATYAIEALVGVDGFGEP